MAKIAREEIMITVLIMMDSMGWREDSKGALSGQDDTTSAAGRVAPYDKRLADSICHFP